MANALNSHQHVDPRILNLINEKCARKFDNATIDRVILIAHQNIDPKVSIEMISIQIDSILEGPDLRPTNYKFIEIQTQQNNGLEKFFHKYLGLHRIPHRIFQGIALTGVAWCCEAVLLGTAASPLPACLALSAAATIVEAIVRPLFISLALKLPGSPLKLPNPWRGSFISINLFRLSVSYTALSYFRSLSLPRFVAIVAAEGLFNRSSVNHHEASAFIA